MPSSTASAMETVTPVDAAAGRFPPRFWWLKRLAAAGLLLVLTLAAVHFTLEAWSRNAWERFVAERRGAGEPVLVEDFVAAAVRDEENGAAVFLGVAARSAGLDVPNMPTVDDFTELSSVRALQPLAHETIASRAGLLCELRAARDLPRSDWGAVVASPLFNITLFHMSPARNIAKLTCAAAMVEHDRCDDAAAVELLIDGLEVGARLRHAEFACLLSDLVAIACDALISSAVESVSFELVIDDGQGGSASRAQVRDLIRRLLDERGLRDGSRQAYFGERAWTMDTFECLASGKLAPLAVGIFVGGPTRLLLPIWRMDCIRAARRQTMLAAALDAPNWPAAQSALPPDNAEEHDPVRWAATIYGRMMASSLSSAVSLHFRCLAQRRMAAIGLAIRLFKLDHGRLPETLRELAPAYLPSIPLDPMAADGRAMGYVRSDGLPRLYSVGLDGIDQGGLIPQSRYPGQTRQEMLFFLTERPWPPEIDLYVSYKLFDADVDDRQVEGDGGEDDQHDDGQKDGREGPEQR